MRPPPIIATCGPASPRLVTHFLLGQTYPRSVRNTFSVMTLLRGFPDRQGRARRPARVRRVGQRGYGAWVSEGTARRPARVRRLGQRGYGAWVSEAAYCCAAVPRG